MHIVLSGFGFYDGERKGHHYFNKEKGSIHAQVLGITDLPYAVQLLARRMRRQSGAGGHE
jgi:hypothetical protein